LAQLDGGDSDRIILIWNVLLPFFSDPDVRFRENLFVPFVLSLARARNERDELAEVGAGAERGAGTGEDGNADIVVIGFIPADAEADATIRTPLLRKIAEGRVPVIYEKDFFNRVGR